MPRGFVLKKEIEKLTSKLTADIMSPRRRKEVKDEYADHIEDLIYQYQLLGMNEKDAFDKARNDIGDANDIKSLLAEVHNNKLQLFIVNKIFHRLRDYFSSKKFAIHLLVVIVAGIIIVATLPIWIYLGTYIYRYFKLISTNTNFVSTAAIVFLIFIAAAIVYIFVFPFLLYICKRILLYFSLAKICLLSNYRLKIKRMPFASLKGVSDAGDVVIVAKNKTFCLHFIDIIFPHRRALTIPNNLEYVITPTSPSRISKLGGHPSAINMSSVPTKAFIATGYTLHKNGDKTKKLPCTSDNDRVTHILLVSAMPIEAKYMIKGGFAPLTNCQEINGMIFCNSSFLKKGLKGKLHNSILG